MKPTANGQRTMAAMMRRRPSEGKPTNDNRRLTFAYLLSLCESDGKFDRSRICVAKEMNVTRWP